MHALNIMWLLNEGDCNTEINISTTKTKHVDWLEIKTNDFKYYIDETGFLQTYLLRSTKEC